MLAVTKFLLLVLLVCFLSATGCSSNDNVFECVINGDFSAVTDIRTGERISENHIEILERLYSSSARTNREFEWIKRDINGDGTEELIWRERDGDLVMPGLQGLFAIFSFKDDEVHLVFMRDASARNFDFFTDTGYLVTIFHISGPYTGFTFRFFSYDENLAAEFIAQLSVLNFYDFSELDADWLNENFPYVAETGEGLCFTKTSVVNGEKTHEIINQERFETLFVEMMGSSLESIASRHFWNDIGVLVPN
jgi:hypothetical protein